MEPKLIISPKIKILDLLADYPELEEVLFDISPAFRQLKNPILRRTVARVTTLQQAALVGGMKVEELVNKLRHATGTDEIPELHSHSAEQEVPKTAPSWYIEERITQHLDAREMLNRGEHPVGQVLADLNKLPEMEIYHLKAPFFPAPLIDKAAAIGFEHYSVELGPEEYDIFFTRIAKL
jgi:hypothetical protein